MDINFCFWTITGDSDLPGSESESEPQRWICCCNGKNMRHPVVKAHLPWPSKTALVDAQGPSGQSRKRDGRWRSPLLVLQHETCRSSNGCRLHPPAVEYCHRLLVSGPPGLDLRLEVLSPPARTVVRLRQTARTSGDFRRSCTEQRSVRLLLGQEGSYCRCDAGRPASPLAGSLETRRRKRRDEMR